MPVSPSLKSGPCTVLRPVRPGDSCRADGPFSNVYNAASDTLSCWTSMEASADRVRAVQGVKSMLTENCR